MTLGQGLQGTLEPDLATSRDGNLPTMGDDRLGRRNGEVDPLLVHQPGHDSEKRSARNSKAEALAHVIRIDAFALPVVGREGTREVGIRARIPAFIDAV